MELGDPLFNSSTGRCRQSFLRRRHWFRVGNFDRRRNVGRGRRHRKRRVGYDCCRIGRNRHVRRFGRHLLRLRNGSSRGLLTTPDLDPHVVAAACGRHREAAAGSARNLDLLLDCSEIVEGAALIVCEHLREH